MQEVMAELCAQSCASCRQRCCKERFCRESVESPFLQAVREGVTGVSYGAKKGWIGPRGCRLEVGRPPICYEYLCPEILYTLDGPDQREAAKDLAEIVAHVGDDLIDGQHAVEVDDQGFDALDRALLEARIDLAILLLEKGKRALGL